MIRLMREAIRLAWRQYRGTQRSPQALRAMNAGREGSFSGHQRHSEGNQRSSEQNEGGPFSGQSDTIVKGVNTSESVAIRIDPHHPTPIQAIACNQMRSCSERLGILMQSHAISCNLMQSHASSCKLKEARLSLTKVASAFPERVGTS